MKINPICKVFPLLTGEEYESLKQDIGTNGQIESIWTYDDQIIDGQNRYKICKELKIEPKFRKWNGKGSLAAFVVSVNLRRRHLSSSQLAGIAVRIEPFYAKEAKERQREAGKHGIEGGRGKKKPLSQDCDKGLSKRDRTASKQAADATGAGQRYVQQAKKIKTEDPAAFDRIMSGQSTIQEVKREQKKKAKETKKKKKSTVPKSIPPKTDRYEIINSEISKAKVEPSSVDWIITDPPYGKKDLSVYKDLGKFAAKVLKPKGSLVCMVGQSYLLEILKALSAHLTYNWTLAYLTPGGQAAQMWDRKVNTFWKPVLWFVKSKPGKDWVGDVCGSKVNENDKRFHKWGQSESGMADLIDRFTYPGETICDPFCGGGTTGVVALKMDRLFIGVDSDKKSVETTLERIAEEVK